MRLVTYEVQGGELSPGAVVGEEIVDLAGVAPDLRALLELGVEGRASAQAAIESGRGRLSREGTILAAPVRPSKFFAIGLNYADHVAESGIPVPENLTVFAKAVSCVNGPYGDVERPAVSEQLDYEGELGFVIGRRCRHVPAERASEVIAGYTIVNDYSVRDWQQMTPQWSIGKSFDTHGPIGPWIVTADELGEPVECDISTSVNGELRQSSNTRELIFSCFDQVEILSKACTLEPGDVVATGTPSGVAAALEGQPWLVPGDRVRVEIEGIGAIENEIVDEQVVADEPSLDRRGAASAPLPP